MKNYELYPSYQRKIDNWRRRIIGYEKMKRDLITQNKKLYNENKKLKTILENVESHTFCDGIHECEVYIGHNCRYSYDDFPCDFCIFCGKPSERK